MEAKNEKGGYLNGGFTPDHLQGLDHTKKAQPENGATSLDVEEIAVEEKENAEVDPWALPELKNTDTPWEDLSGLGKVGRVMWYVLRLVALIGLLYMFICSLDVLSSAFRLLGGKAAGEAMSNTVLFSNPIAGLMLGVLATVLVQSSSTSTSIIVSMVSADLLPVYLAIPMIMGSNIGTTVTNTIVAMGQSADRGDFRRAFAAATVHDMFNWLSVLVFLPLEWATRYLFHLTKAIVDHLPEPSASNSTAENPEFLKAVTKPFTDTIVMLSSSKIRDIALGKEVNGTIMTGDSHLFGSWSGSDAAVGGILLAGSLCALCLCLVLIVKLLASMLQGTMASLLQRFINSDLPGPFRHLTGYLAILIGAGMTILVQSSSIFTSAITPLVGIGAIHIERMYPLTLGSNIGTTVTGVLAALASDPIGFKNSFQVAMCHLFFNLSGILLWFPVPVMRKLPIAMAKAMGDTVYLYRWFAPVYLVGVYFLFPLLIFGLSLAGWQVLLGVGLPIFVFVIVIVVINILQTKKPQLLPAKLRSWVDLGVPEPLRSLDPYDRVIRRLSAACQCCRSKADADSPAASSSEDDLEAKKGQGRGQGRDQHQIKGRSEADVDAEKGMPGTFQRRHVSSEEKRDGAAETNGGSVPTQEVGSNGRIQISF